ncbi:dephospho-CoA kinase [Porphyromonas levii]|uniref:dephospho-CoA kinase n=1 Tax=Porphyromonas levii TaxID=28114 RepID=UPI001B8AFB04|nr:dephospho-CoA kinase [Porphyromonas levii]MBR8703934.1 Dephospho-CoA kinase [Porphyromonas levii]MBR8714018.1 Dephospho-CoA kinase [Porphyromonas levii]MBR8716026.1 Dephospho-CoA kinase [Porphyromonas levii]MBR8728555.1 Dephospho-CoA kinase [Porphyromonas levii]MBR8730243.1 Dephospho-CoA kinase [Porphyromonas levii]
MGKVIGICGLIGSGKSVVREALTTLYDIPCFDSDSVAKGVYFDALVIGEIESQLGFLPIDRGLLNKGRLKETLSNPRRKAILEDIVHRAVAREFEKWRSEQGTQWVGIESAILFTSGFYRLCDTTLAVEAPEEVRFQRVQQRDSERSIDEFRQIEAIQEEEGRRQRGEADIKIDNSGTSSITRAIEALWERLINYKDK